MQKPSWKCRLGLHRYEWRAVVFSPKDTGLLLPIEQVQYRCNRDGCTKHQVWKPAHEEIYQ